jgi:hypothetical protein
MIDYKATVRVTIDGVEEVLVEPAKDGVLEKYRIITVRTKQGETFALVLQSDGIQKLAFQKQDTSEDCLAPKLYNDAMNDKEAGA